MPLVSPFVGLLYDVSRVGTLERVTTPPYDTISPSDQRRYLDSSPYNVIHLDLGEDAPGDDVDGKYRRAASWLRTWRDDGVLVPTPRPSCFPYEMRFAYHGSQRTIRGLVCAVGLEDWGGTIVPHEETLPGPIEDRLRLIRATSANLSAIQAVFGGPAPALEAMLERAGGGPPAARMVDEQGVEHRLWVVEEDPAVAAELSSAELMIADGHHRYTTALRYRDEMRNRTGPGPWDAVMMLIVDAGAHELPVLPFHRVLTRGPVPSGGTLVRDLEEVLAEVDDAELRYGVAALAEDGTLVHRVAELEGDPPTVCALHHQVLDGRDDDLWYTPDPVEAELAVRSTRAAAAVILPSTTALRIRDVVARGERLPQKSTYFYPKPRTGLVLRPFDGTLIHRRSARAS